MAHYPLQEVSKFYLQNFIITYLIYILLLFIQLQYDKDTDLDLTA